MEAFHLNLKFIFPTYEKKNLGPNAKFSETIQKRTKPNFSVREKCYSLKFFLKKVMDWDEGS